MIEILPENKFKLNFFDYGNVETVDGSDIRDILECHLAMKRQAIACRIQDIASLSTDGVWSQAEKQWFCDTFQEQTVSLKPSNRKEGEVHVIDLILEGGVTASQLIVKQGKGRKADSPVPSNTPSQAPPTKPPPEPQRVESAHKIYTRADLPTVC